MTLAAGLGDPFEGSIYAPSTCPCQGGADAPAWVGTYACESPTYAVEIDGAGAWHHYVDGNDKLFDGAAVTAACSGDLESGTYLEAPLESDAAVEVRLMGDEPPENEDVLIKKLELWVR